MICDIIWQILSPFDKAIHILAFFQIYIDISILFLARISYSCSNKHPSFYFFCDYIFFDLFLYSRLIVFRIELLMLFLLYLLISFDSCCSVYDSLVKIVQRGASTFALILFLFGQFRELDFRLCSHVHFHFDILHGTLNLREGRSYGWVLSSLFFNGFLLFGFLKLLVQTIKLLHFFDTKTIFFFSTELTAFTFLYYSFTENLRWFRGGSDLVNDIRIYIVFEGRWVKFFQSVFNFFLRGEFQEVLKTVPLFIVNVYRQLRVRVFVLIAQILSIF